MSPRPRSTDSFETAYAKAGLPRSALLWRRVLGTVAGAALVLGFLWPLCWALAILLWVATLSLDASTLPRGWGGTMLGIALYGAALGALGWGLLWLQS